ncbi:MAG: CvpA family protein [Prolixibacteraceae bacterium]|nr:CvpA family protein [Prolixibacteraceae bacterium]MBN2774269.1 CvpA family protein [Prolixibacteraceae bacterium]
MNYINIILFVLLLFAAISGFKKGLVSELASLAALILGIWGAFEFSDITADFLVENFNWHWDHLNVASLIITFVVIVILVHIVGSVVDKVIEAAMLGFLNRLAGIIFGVLKSALILSVLLVVLDRIDRDVSILPENKKAESKLYQPIRNFAPAIFPFIEDWVKDIKYENGAKTTQNTTVV